MSNLETPEVVKHYRLGIMFYQGEVIDQDLVEARRQFKLGWEAKGCKSGFNYAKMLYGGIGGEQDIQTALSIFGKVASDYPDAYYEMYKYQNATRYLVCGQLAGSRKCSLEYGKTVEESNETEAMKSYEFAANGPDDEIKVEACDRLGLLQKKRGDTIGALNNLIYSAEKGLNDSRYHLGLLYLDQNKSWDALREFQKATDEGHHRAEFELIKMGVLGYYYVNNQDSTMEMNKLYDRVEEGEELKEEIALFLGDHYIKMDSLWEAFEWYSVAKASLKTQEILEKRLAKIEEDMKKNTGTTFDYDKQEEAVNEVMVRCPATGDIMDKCLYHLGYIAYCRGNYEEAMAYYDDGINYDGCKYRTAYLLSEGTDSDTWKPDLSPALFYVNQVLEESTDTDWLVQAKILKRDILEKIDEQDELPPLEEAFDDKDEVIIYHKIPTPIEVPFEENDLLSILNEEKNESEISDEYVEIPSVIPVESEGEKDEIDTPREAKSQFVSTVEKLFNGKEDADGNIYLMGYLYMMSGDNKKAKEEFKKSARMGHRDSLIKLGELSLEEE